MCVLKDDLRGVVALHELDELPEAHGARLVVVQHHHRGLSLLRRERRPEDAHDDHQLLVVQLPRLVDVRLFEGGLDGFPGVEVGREVVELGGDTPPGAHVGEPDEEHEETDKHVQRRNLPVNRRLDGADVNHEAATPRDECHEQKVLLNKEAVLGFEDGSLLLHHEHHQPKQDHHDREERVQRAEGHDFDDEVITGPAHQ
mmetsp:Transcript_21650/g.48948  ORF Transcript_21650/g.48948 Transcript_21650/m.48948 type:complete len:200 (-) Transcript_21650:523-1122(-)